MLCHNTKWPTTVIITRGKQLGCSGARRQGTGRVGGEQPGTGRLAAKIVGQRVDRLVAQRIDPPADGQRVRHQHVNALHPVGHAARRHGDTEIVEVVAHLQIGLVGQRYCAASSGSAASCAVISRMTPTDSIRLTAEFSAEQHR